MHIQELISDVLGLINTLWDCFGLKLEDNAVIILFRRQHLKPNLDIHNIIICDRVLSKFKENKSPGSDGLPIEFDKQFCHLLKNHMTTLFNEALGNEKLSDSQNQGILTMLHKKGDPQL